jgi:hypothetical protein
MANSDVERIAIEHVMGLERVAGRQPEDVHLDRRFAYDIASPPRKIEVKAFGGSARGAALPLEDRQVQAAREDPRNFYVYVVDNVADGERAITIRVLHGDALQEMLDRATPQITYWPTFRTSDYDEIKEGLSLPRLSPQASHQLVGRHRTLTYPVDPEQRKRVTSDEPDAPHETTDQMGRTIGDSEDANSGSAEALP